MYRNDSLRFLINGHSSAPLWLTQGVKQGIYSPQNCITYDLILGCNLSPLLFSLFMNNLGLELNSSGLGIDLGTTNISAIFFADDIVILGNSRSALNTLMETTRLFFSHHRLELSVSKSKIMSNEAVTGKTTFQGSSKLSPLSLDQVLSFKYLGVPVSCSPYSLFKSYNEQVKKKAQNYLSSVLSLVRTGPDRSTMAFTLWTRCALPSILYGCEVLPLNQGTISEVERCQAQVGKFILQLPRNSASVSSSIDAGLKPIWAVIAEKVLLYAHSTMSKTPSYWPKIAMDENIGNGTKSPYTRYLMKWRHATDSFGLHPKLIKASVTRAAIVSVLDEQRKTCVSTFAMNGPGSSLHNRWFTPKTWVNDSCFSKIISEFRACNSGLGNRGPTKDGQFFKLCPLCTKAGLTAINNEVHIILLGCTLSDSCNSRSICWLIVLR